MKGEEVNRKMILCGMKDPKVLLRCGWETLMEMLGWERVDKAQTRRCGWAGKGKKKKKINKSDSLYLSA